MSTCVKDSLPELYIIRKNGDHKLLRLLIQTSNKELIFAFSEIFTNLLAGVLTVSTVELQNKVNRRKTILRRIAKKSTSIEERRQLLIRLLGKSLLQDIVNAILTNLENVR
jgi:hypothetical protein